MEDYISGYYGVPHIDHHHVGKVKKERKTVNASPTHKIFKNTRKRGECAEDYISGYYGIPHLQRSRAFTGLEGLHSIEKDEVVMDRKTSKVAKGRKTSTGLVRRTCDTCSLCTPENADKETLNSIDWKFAF